MNRLPGVNDFRFFNENYLAERFEHELLPNLPYFINRISKIADDDTKYEIMDFINCFGLKIVTNENLLDLRLFKFPYFIMRAYLKYCNNSRIYIDGNLAFTANEILEVLHLRFHEQLDQWDEEFKQYVES